MDLTLNMYKKANLVALNYAINLDWLPKLHSGKPA